MFILFGLFLTLGVACDSCEEKKPKEEDAGPPPKKVEDMKPDIPPEDPLKAEKEDAESKAQTLAVQIGDRARLVGGEIEAMANKPKTKRDRPRIKKSYTGKIDAREASKVFSKYEGAMRKCYERSLKRNPGLQGDVTLRVVVRTDGKVHAARVQRGSLGDDIVYACMKRYAKRMKFPAPEGGVAKIDKRYKFKPQL